MEGVTVSTEGFTIRDVMDPMIAPHGRIDVHVESALLAQVAALSPWKFWNVRPAGPVLRDPEAILYGARLDKDGKARCWAYTGLPMFVHDGKGGYLPRPPGLVYVAYVDPEHRLYEWGLERAAADRPFLPHDYAERFPGGTTWIKPS